MSFNNKFHSQRTLQGFVVYILSFEIAAEHGRLVTFLCCDGISVLFPLLVYQGSNWFN